jgi:hypothetical protein
MHIESKWWVDFFFFFFILFFDSYSRLPFDKEQKDFSHRIEMKMKSAEWKENYDTLRDNVWYLLIMSRFLCY